MLRKTKKVISIACVLIFILPIMSYSMDKEEFLKFLIESSYPESSTKDDNSKEKEDEVDKTANKEEDYIKVHIGEENIPTLNNNSNNKENVSVSSSEYKNDIRLTKENPTMLIYHSHAGETYSDSPEGNYHSQNKEKSVIEVGTLLTEQLSKKGWGILKNGTALAAGEVVYPAMNRQPPSRRPVLRSPGEVPPTLPASVTPVGLVKA